MRYNDPVSGDARQAVGLDAVLLDLRAAFNAVPWLNGYVYLRAYKNKWVDAVEKTQISPQIYMGAGEYYEAVLNDNLTASVFFMVVDDEIITFDKKVSTRSMTHTRNMAMIFVGDLRRMDVPFKVDSIYSESIKKQLIKILANSKHVELITKYVDDPIEDVFKELTIPERMNSGKYPHVAVRIEFTVTYKTDVKTNC